MILKHFTLDLNKKISETFLKSMWRKVCVNVHPDKGGSHEAYLEAQAEYEMLQNHIGMVFANDMVEDFESWDMFFANVHPMVKEAFLFAFNEVPNVKAVEICGTWVYVSLDYKNKEGREIVKAKEIGERKFFWAKGKKKWIWALYTSGQKYGFSMDKIRDMWGSKRMEKEQEKEEKRKAITN